MYKPFVLYLPSTRTFKTLVTSVILTTENVNAAMFIY